MEDFDPIEQYRIPPGSKVPPIKKQTKQTKMGEVSNLITDMTIKGANTNELARAVRHSMVVIDSEKHNLDYRQSYIDHGISQLSERYQGRTTGGAATLVSRAKSQERVLDRKERSMKEGGPIDPLTGKKVYTPTGRTYTIPTHTIPAHVSPKGRLIPEKEVPEKTYSRMLVSNKMTEAFIKGKDAHSLSSGRQVEGVYADHANALKAMGNDARRNMIATKTIPMSPSAKKVYAHEVAILNSKLNVALKNKPLERQAQILANSLVLRKKQASPDMDKDDLKKVKNQALAEARVRVGTDRKPIEITDREWQAIQAGAISTHTLNQILQNANPDRVKQLATPRKTRALSTTKMLRAERLLNSGATRAQVAEALGVSVTTLNNALDLGAKS